MAAVFSEKPHHIAVHVSTEVGDSASIVEKLMKAIEEQVKKDIPILTCNVSIPASSLGEYDSFFRDLSRHSIIHDNKIKVMVIGQWYDTGLVETFKALCDASAEYDSFFLNFGICYDGQEEIVRALRLLAKKCAEGRISSDEITKDMVKDNLASSYYVPPEIIIETGKGFSGLLMWDSPGAIIYHDVEWKDSLGKAIEFRRKVLNPPKFSLPLLKKEKVTRNI